MNPLTAALGYVRASTNKQGLSIEAQAELCERTAEYHQLGPIEIFSEPATSGDKPFFERRAALELVAQAQARTAAGQTVTVICTKVDRLARDTVDASNTSRWFEQAGIRLLLLDVNVDTRTPMGRAFLQLAAVFAELELGRIRERTTTALDHKRANGYLCGTVPFGWDAELTGETSGKGQPLRRTVPNLTEQAIIRELLAWRAAGWGYNRCANELNRRQVATKTGKTWHNGSVRKVLQSRMVRDWLAATPTDLAA